MRRLMYSKESSTKLKLALRVFQSFTKLNVFKGLSSTFANIFYTYKYMYMSFYKYKLFILVSLFGSRLKLLSTLRYTVTKLVRLRYAIT